MSKSKYYDGTKLRNTLDMHGLRPEIYIVVSRVRGPGKTTDFGKFLLDSYFYGGEGLVDDVYFEKGAKFTLLVRKKLQLGDTANGMFKGVMDIFYPEYTIYEKIRSKGLFSEVYVEKGIGDDKITHHVGYVVPLSASGDIKNISSMFVDTAHSYFDEFMLEDDSGYLSDEVKRFLLIHGSLARGEGEQRRYYPVYMSANTVSIQNPYFTALGFTSKIQHNTMFYRGDGFVYQRTENASLAQQHAETPMSRAFKNAKIIDYVDNSWLNDDATGIEKPDGWGRGDYVCTLVDKDRQYAVKQYREVGLFYVDYKVDTRSKYVYNIDFDSGANAPIIRSTSVYSNLRDRLFKGEMRFQNLEVKRTMMDLLT